LDDKPKNLDLSSKSYDHFVEFFFNREVVSEDKLFYLYATDLSGERYDEAIPSSPAILVEQMTKLFSEFGEIATKYSLSQIDQGIWGILGPSFHSLYRLVFADAVPLPSRLECIRSMYFVYSDFVARSESEPDPNLSGFFMWWDFLLHGFWSLDRPVIPGTYRGDASKLDGESRIMLDEMFETLKRILDLPHTETQRCALHGLGHLYHPEVHDTVQQYIDAKKSDLPLAWLEECRDGTVQ
jgi:hypothetical protein